ncbi:MAG: hexokinase [Treponema sp.]|nr:hexokinase [Treponema sp.]
MNKKINAFLSRHNFPVSLNINDVVEAVLYDMDYELKNTGVHKGQEMIRTYMLPPEASLKNESVIVIDAGGTNFRSCLVSFDENGIPSISDMEKCAMPAVDRELSKKEFFDQIAFNLEHLKDKATKIGFCFSYSMTITSDGDCIVNSFSKGVKAPEVCGCKVGASLKEALLSHGWKKIDRISLINDTVAALLAGASLKNKGFAYSSYIGFILGTGMNLAYIQPSIKDILDKQIIVCESGNFNYLSLSDFDKAMDSKTTRPGYHLIEKQCSGAYLGPLALEVIQCAGREGLFSSAFAKELLDMKELSLIQLDSFLHAPAAFKSTNATEEDKCVLYQLYDAIKRAAV